MMGMLCCRLEGIFLRKDKKENSCSVGILVLRTKQEKVKKKNKKMVSLKSDVKHKTDIRNIWLGKIFENWNEIE